MNHPCEYDLEVTLADLPRGWAVAAIGEGKPVAAPPPVLDEIRQLRSERDEAKRLQETERQRADAYSYRMKLLDVELFDARAQLKALQKLYYELLYLVGMKHPGETRHETAARYIRQAENHPTAEAQEAPREC